MKTTVQLVFEDIKNGLISPRMTSDKSITKFTRSNNKPKVSIN